MLIAVFTFCTYDKLIILQCMRTNTTHTHTHTHTHTLFFFTSMHIHFLLSILYAGLPLHLSYKYMHVDSV